jgi:hypothetical protein
MTVRHLMWASLATGLIAVVWYVNSLSDPAYYDPQTIADYAASVLAEIFFLSAAYTLAVWWRVTPVRRSALLILGAAGGFALWSVGNVLEEIMDISIGEGIYFVGAGLALVLTAIGGVVTLTAPSRWRWSGVVLLAIPASFLLEDVLTGAVAVIPWLGFAYVLWRGMLDVPSEASSQRLT